VAVVEALGDQEHRIGTVHPGLDDLIKVDDELLAEHGQIDRATGRLQVGEAAAEAGVIREHGEGSGSAAGIGRGDLRHGRRGANLARRRAATLELGDQSQRRCC